MKSAEFEEVVFDSHRFVKRLTGVGLDERVAEVLAEEHVGLLTGNLATKTALANTDAGLRAELASTDAGLRAELANVEGKLRAELANLEGKLRAELANLEGKLRAQLAATETRIRADLEKRLAELRAELLKWTIGALTAQAALIVALVKLLP